MCPQKQIAVTLKLLKPKKQSCVRHSHYRDKPYKYMYHIEQCSQQTRVSLTRPCFHLHLRWRGAVSQPARGPMLQGADLCSQNSPAGLEEPGTGSHPPLAAR